MSDKPTSNRTRTTYDDDVAAGVRAAEERRAATEEGDDGGPYWDDSSLSWEDGEPAPTGPAKAKKRPTIICLCGSTRFADEFIAASRRETLAGKIVLSVGLFGHAEALDMGGPVKAMLDELHLRKIDLAHEVLVVSKDGYLGSSTLAEIRYAIAHGKSVRWMEDRTKERFDAMAQR